MEEDIIKDDEQKKPASAESSGEAKENSQNEPFDTAQDKQNLYQCKECGLHYKGKEMAEKCETWCKEHKTCNVEIIKDAEENKQPFDSSQGKLKELEFKCEEYLNNWKRAAADMANYKKEEMERMAFLGKYAKEDMILKILPILDNIQLAEKQLPEKLKEAAINSSTRSSTEAHSKSSPQVEWTKGFLQIQKQIDEFLKKEGIEEIKTSVGEKFNPETMEAVVEAESSDNGTTEGGDAGTIIEEVRKGYIMNDKVLRPAKVKVTK